MTTTCEKGNVFAHLYIFCSAPVTCDFHYNVNTV